MLFVIVPEFVPADYCERHVVCFLYLSLFQLITVRDMLSVIVLEFVPADYCERHVVCYCT